MAFVYRGNLLSLQAEVTDVADAVNAKYREILGDVRYEKLEEVSQRLLTPEAFYDNFNDIERDLGKKVNGTNKMMVISPTEFKFKKDGNLKNKKIRTSVAFYISKEGFEKSGSSQFTQRQVASYIHEFDHFIAYTLQQTPLYIANQILQEGMNQELQDSIPERERINTNVAMLQMSQILMDMHEKANRILDKMVLSSIGIDVTLPWRGKEKTYGLMRFPTGVAMLPTGGDPFNKWSDQEAIEKYLDWKKFLNFNSNQPYVKNVLESVREVRVSRVPLAELLQE